MPEMTEFDIEVVSQAKAVLAARAGEVSSLVSELAYRRYRNDGSMANKIAVEAAAEAFMRSGNRDEALEILAAHVDEAERVEELIRLVGRSPQIGTLTTSIVDRVHARHPEVERQLVSEVVSRTVLFHMESQAAAVDPSTPWDMVGDQRITVIFVPGSGEHGHESEVATTSWLTKSDSLAIFPDRTFLDFLKVVGVTKREWLEGVDAAVTPGRRKRLAAFMDERERVWADVPEWTTRSQLDLEVEDIVDAVDACPFGFTPMIAYEMEAQALFGFEYGNTMSVTGGIIGLHDFTNGTGDPVRFEGTLEIRPEPGDLHVSDDHPLGLIAIHGFLPSTFRSSVAVSHGPHAVDAPNPPSP